MFKESGRSWPVLCPEDDVIDYMVMEAVALKAAEEDKEARKKAEEEREREEFKKDHSGLEQFR